MTIPFRSSLVLLPLLAAAAPARALDPERAITQYRFDAWTTRNGLPQGSVESIAQTRDGYLWLGTQEGLARFDGLAFTVFDRSNTPALQHNRVFALHVDRDGTLWIGTEGGGLTRYRDGSFATFSTSDGLPGDRVRAFAEDSASRLWVGADGGLVAWGTNGAAGSVLLAGRSILSLTPGPDRSLWIGAATGLYRMREGQDPEAVAIPGRGPVTALWVDDDGTVWIGRTRMLLSLRAGTATVEASGSSLPGRQVRALERDRNGTLWLGSEGGGLARLRAGRLEAFTMRDGLTNDMVLRLFEDREGSLWLGMQDGGLARLADSRFVTWTTREGLADDIVWPVLEDRQGRLWVGTSAGGLSRMSSGAVRNYTTRDGLSGNAIQALAEDRTGALWIGTRGSGLDRLVGERVTVFTTRDGLPGESVSALCAARDGSLWIGTRGNGVARFANGRFRAFGTATGPATESVHAIHEDRLGQVWMATNGGGLVRYAGGAFRAFTRKDGLSADVVNALHEDADGTLWIGTYGGGLDRLRGGRFTAYTTADGLFDDAIFQVLDDGLGYLWMSCNKGIFRVARKDFDAVDRGEQPQLRSEAYGVQDGMKNRECNGANQPAGWRRADGRLVFPTVGGLVEIDPAHLPRNPLPPPVVIEGLAVDGRRLAIRNGFAFEPDSESFEFQYAGLGLRAPERVRFRYRLEGLDRGWVDAGTRRTAYYTRIPPGRYRFVVSAANEDGVWNEEGAALSFRLLPHFYRTPWFSALVALVVLAGASGGYHLRVRQLRSHEAMLVRLVDQRTGELAEANARLERLSSLDGLTGIANRRRFDEALDVEWRRACRAGSPLSLMLLDVDAFKAFNDTYGHLAGDECLRQVAEALANSLNRAADLAARYGGEEFVALLPNTAASEVLFLAERLRARIEALAIAHQRSTTAGVVTVSIGCATVMPSDDTHSSALLALADAHLYSAKRKGGNHVLGPAETSQGPGTDVS